MRYHTIKQEKWRKVVIKKLRSVFSAFAMLAVVVTPAAAQDGGKDLERIVSEKVVRLGVVEAYPLHRLDLETGNWTGINPDIIEAIFGAIGVSVEHVPTDWGTAAAGLQSGRFDLIGGFSPTPERGLVVAFTDTVMRVPVGLASTSAEAQGRATSWKELNKPEVRISLTDGSATARILQRMLPDATYVAVRSEDAAILEVESGRVDYFAASVNTLNTYARERGESIHISVPEPQVGQNSSFALRRGERDFQDWLNVSLGALAADGTIPSIYDKYLNPQE